MIEMSDGQALRAHMPPCPHLGTRPWVSSLPMGSRPSGRACQRENPPWTLPGLGWLLFNTLGENELSLQPLRV